MNWDKVIEAITPLKIPTEIVISMALLVALFLSFAPENILVQLKLIDFIQENQFAISMYMLIAIAYWIVIISSLFFKWIKQKIDIRNNMKVQINLLIKLKPKLKAIILDLYNNGSTGYLNMNEPETGYLRATHIIERASNIGTHRMTFGYFLQPWVVDYLDNDRNYNKFVKEVEEDEV